MLAWGYPNCFLLGHRNCNFGQLGVWVLTRETSAKTRHKANTLQETVRQKAYDQNSQNRGKHWVCISTSEYRWTSQDTARNGYQLLQLRLGPALFHGPRKKTPSCSPFSGLFLLRAVGSMGTWCGHVSGAEKLWQSRYNWQKQLYFLHWNLCMRVPLKIQHCNLIEKPEMYSTVHSAPSWSDTCDNSCRLY